MAGRGTSWRASDPVPDPPTEAGPLPTYASRSDRGGRPGGTAQLPGNRQRAVLGLLDLRCGQVVTRSALIDRVWGKDAPRTAAKTLHSHITRIRQALAGLACPDRLVTREPGYTLLVSAADTDAGRFEDELRLARAELRLGRHGTAAGELDRLVAAHPYRERLIRLLMLARYRSGCHAEALEAYQRPRVRLADELGVDPGPELQRLYTRMLRRDPGLDTKTGSVHPVARLLPG